MLKLKSPHEIKELQLCLEASETARPCISVCAGSGCKASGADNVLQALHRELEKRGLQGSIEVKSTGCHGFCERGPVMIVWPEKTFYNKVAAANALDIVNSVSNGHKPVEKLLYQDPVSGKKVEHEDEVPFYARQQRVLFANNGKIDPKNIEDYLRIGGYAAMAKVLASQTPEQVVETITKSGLRGRGGAGFPTGVKWSLCRQNGKPNGHGEVERFLICNADEGDPGAFMDRSLLEGNPHSVIEGMIIGSFALGAHQGYVYVRAEYPLAVQHLM